MLLCQLEDQLYKCIQFKSGLPCAGCIEHNSNLQCSVTVSIIDKKIKNCYLVLSPVGTLPLIVLKLFICP